MAKKKKVKDFRENLIVSSEFPERRQKAVLLDTPYLEDCFIQDLTAGATSRNAVKQGWEPTFSRYTSYDTPNETRPGVRKYADQMNDGAVEEGPTDQDDYKEVNIFARRYR